MGGQDAASLLFVDSNQEKMIIRKPYLDIYHYQYVKAHSCDLEKEKIFIVTTTSEDAYEMARFLRLPIGKDAPIRVVFDTGFFKIYSFKMLKQQFTVRPVWQVACKNQDIEKSFELLLSQENLFGNSGIKILDCQSLMDNKTNRLDMVLYFGLSQRTPAGKSMAKFIITFDLKYNEKHEIYLTPIDSKLYRNPNYVKYRRPLGKITSDIINRLFRKVPICQLAQIEFDSMKTVYIDDGFVIVLE
jgi:hypothetical protein